MIFKTNIAFDQCRFTCLSVLFVAAFFGSLTANAETRGYVVSVFHKATYSHSQNCPNGTGGNFVPGYLRAFRTMGLSEERIANIMLGKEGPLNGYPFIHWSRNRGRINGKPADIYSYPDSEPDPGYDVVSGPYAYGFNLDGDASGSHSFADPETGEKGVDNQLFRAVGCFANYAVSSPTVPLADDTVWVSTYGNKIQAWIFTVTGNNLDQDGQATVRFYRAIEHLRTDAAGKGLADITYVIDAGSGSYGTFNGTFKSGMFTSDKSDIGLLLEGDTSLPKLELSNARMRLKLKPDGTSEAFLAGYQPWLDVLMGNIYIGEGMGVDNVGLFYNLKRMADAQPDPETGQNMAISSTYRIVSVPAFIARLDGNLITDNL